MNDKRRSPHSIPVDDLAGTAPKAANRAAHSLPVHQTSLVEDAADQTPPTARPRRSWIRRILGSGLTLLLVGLTSWIVEDLLTSALIDNSWTAWLLIAGVSLSVVSIIAFIGREWLALENLDRLRTLRDQISVLPCDPKTTAILIKQLRRLYGQRADLEWAWVTVDQSGISEDSDDLIHLIEREVFGQLDQRAHAIVISGVRRSATMTAISPFPALDVVATAIILAGMLRRLARLYGGRPGWLATWRLLRMSLNAVLASGLLDLGDDTLGDALGVGLVSKLSRRASIGILNGLLAARIGVSAIALIRPLPQKSAPSARSLLLRALTELRVGRTD